MLKIEKLLNELKAWAVSERPLDILVQAVEQGRGEMSVRVFNSEVGTKDVNGAGLGKYSNSYAKQRSRSGRQSKVKDLEFTGALRRDIRTVRNGKNILIAAPSIDERKKISYIEEQSAKNIFDLSKNERSDVYSLIDQNLYEDYKMILNEYL
jgi:hypothetical protein